MNTNWLWVRFQVEGWHKWPGASEKRRYLANSHRHMFHVEAAVEVAELDREIEFHDLKDACIELFPGGDMGAKSCEMMATDLGNALLALLGPRRLHITVSEDGEVGATIEIDGRRPTEPATEE